MACKRCGAEGVVDRDGFCEECAREETALASGVMKTSTIVVAAGETTGVYRSLKELPPDLQRKLRRATNGANAGTILIADKRGRDEIARVIRKLPNAAAAAEPPSRLWNARMQQAVGMTLIVCTLILIWLVFTNRF